MDLECTGVYERVGMYGLKLEGVRQRCRDVQADMSSKIVRKKKKGQQPSYEDGIGLENPSLQTNAAKRATV
jgi:hypothetical protein